jgi:H+/Cl- antiporter ClcA
MNVLKTLITVCICFFACWTLNQVIWFGYQCGAVVDFTSWYYHLSVIMVLLSSIINPFVYASQYKQFQDGIRQLFRCIHKPAISTTVMTVKTNDTALPGANSKSHNIA